ncbi:MAG: hypothetical protein JXR51_05025 [Bacteroidales bacterium]|nr:hypothetical protein [Bacteroidales bacterium]MBN2756522.1 hypothetical protein [Bacteroidales bacterium]
MKTNLENILKKRFIKDEIVLYINSNQNIFNEAFDLAISDKHPQAWRASWLLGHSIKQNDIRIKPFVNKIIEIIKDKKDGHQRELLKIIEKFEVEEEQEGMLFNVCMNIWESINKSSSVRIVAFRILMKIAKKYPELNNEIDFLSQSHYLKNLSPGIKHSFEKIKSK